MSDRNLTHNNIFNDFSILACLSVLILSGCNNATDSEEISEVVKNQPSAASPAITKGRATKNIQQVYDCDVPGWRVTATGQINSADGQVWIVPAENSYATSLKAADLFNECTGVTLNNITELDVNSIPVVDIDADGEIITAYFFGDNYFEFYVNGQTVAVDPVPYWPFNTSAIRFKAKKPFVAGVKMIDWSENLGCLLYTSPSPRDRG